MPLVISDIIDDTVTLWESLDPDFAGASTEIKANVKAGLVTALVTTIVDHLTTNATVAFSVGGIVGTDVPNGDSHSTLTASGGKIS